jgi:HSP20 family protein
LFAAPDQEVITMALPVRRTNTTPETPAPGRWDPFAEINRLNHQLADYLNQWPIPLGDAFTPLADVEETDDAYTVEIELPGIRQDDLDIELTGRRLTVSGERREKERVGILRRRERVVGRFHYEVSLPGNVVEDAVEAHLDHGVLTIRVPKPESERPRRIKIG